MTPHDLAADQGLEPQLTAPEAVVLPLDESAILQTFFTILQKVQLFNTSLTTNLFLDILSSKTPITHRERRRVMLFISDLGFAMLWTSVMCNAFDVPLHTHWGLLALALMCSVLPDFDALFLGGITAHKDNPHNHRDLFHYPLVFLPALALVAGALGGVVDGSVRTGIISALLACACTSTHFVNDSFGVGWGVKWLWPFSNKAYKFFVDTYNTPYVHKNPMAWVTAWEPAVLHERIKSHGDKNWLRKYLISTWFVAEIAIFTVGAVALLFAWFDQPPPRHY